MQNLVSSLDHQTRHLRGAKLAPAVKSKFIPSVPISCEAHGAEMTWTGFKFCAVVPGVFGCNIMFDIPQPGWCSPPLVCAADAGPLLKVGALAKYCVEESGNKIVEVQIRLCMNAVSDIIRAVGLWLPQNEVIFNKFNIFGGCYRLAYGKYSITHKRLEVVMDEHRVPIVGGLVGGLIVRISGHARFRFKGNGCPYNDNIDWYMWESMVKHVRDGAHSDWQYKYKMLPEWSKKDTCSWKSGGWAQFGINFKLTMDYPWTDVQNKCTGGGLTRLPRKCARIGWKTYCTPAVSVRVPKICAPVPRVYMKVKELYKYDKEFVFKTF